MDKLCETINRQCCLHCEMECDGKWLETEIEMYKEDLLKKQSDKIADLEAKLAQAKMNESFEKEKKDNAFKLIEELKQQLAEKEKDFKDAEQCAVDYQDRNTELEQEVNYFKGLLDLEVDYRNKLLKKQNQTAIDELEKVRKLALQHIIDIKNDLSEEHDEYLNQKHTIHGCSIVILDIDQQIAKLKGEK